MADPTPEDDRALLKRYAKKLEIESVPAYVKLLLGKELGADDLTPDQARKVVNALRLKAQRLGVALEGPAKRGDVTEKQLEFIESLVGRGRISHAMLTGYVKDVDPNASIPEQLSKKAASKLIDRLTGLGGQKKKRDEDDPFST